MEGFTLVLLIGWLLLVATFVAMYFMDQATKKAAESRSDQPAEAPEKPR
jgi:hypothetical protein